MASVDLGERRALAEIHKRIREEKQKNGNVLTVAEAKKLIEEEAKGQPKPRRLSTIKSDRNIANTR